MRKLEIQRLFIASAAVAALVLIGLGAFWLIIEGHESIDKINLAVDIVVGFFTVWGLYWAASEFAASAVTAEIRCLAEVSSAGVSRNQLEYIYEKGILDIDATSAYVAIIPLALENKETKAGRNIQLVINASANPAPIAVAFHGLGIVPSSGPWGPTEIPVVKIQFPEEILVYETSIQAGNLYLGWDKYVRTDDLPRMVKLDYSVFSLDGSSRDSINLQLDWRIPPDEGDGSMWWMV